MVATPTSCSCARTRRDQRASEAAAAPADNVILSDGPTTFRPCPRSLAHRAALPQREKPVARRPLPVFKSPLEHRQLRARLGPTQPGRHDRVRGRPPKFTAGFEQHLHAVPGQDGSRRTATDLLQPQPGLPPPGAASACLRPILAARPPPWARGSRALLQAASASRLDHKIEACRPINDRRVVVRTRICLF